MLELLRCWSLFKWLSEVTGASRYRFLPVKGFTPLSSTSTIIFTSTKNSRWTFGVTKIAIYCPQGSGTLRQQLLMMHWLIINDYARVCQSMPEYARICQRMPEYARVCRSMPEYARVCQSMQEYARVCQSMPEYARVCQSMPEYSRVCQSLAKFCLYIAL